MRTTLAIADAIRHMLKRIARVAGDTLRVGLAHDARCDDPRRYRQRVFALGNPSANLDRSLRIAAALEDEETARKLDAPSERGRSSLDR